MISYFKNLGVALDETLNVLLLNGDPGQTISYHAAIAEEDGRRWGCWLCWALARLIQPRHCPLQLEPGAEPTSAALRAGVLLVAVAIGIVLGADALFRLFLRLL
jgi:hypothetical protein